MDSYTTEQLYMCENCKLVDYILDLQDELKSVKEEKDEVWEQCGKVTSKKLKLHTENERLKKQVSRLQDDIIIKIQNQYGEQLEALEKENEKLHTEIEEQKEELHQSQKLNEEFNKELMDNYIDEVQKLKEFINQQKVTVVKLDEHGQELSK